MNEDEHPFLLVEDNDDDVILMRYALRDAQIGNRLDVVTSGDQALETLARACAAPAPRKTLPGVIFLDLKLPHVSGFDVLQWIRGQPLLEDVFVVVLTSSDQPGDIRRAYALGANSYVVKPPTAEQLRELVQASKWTPSVKLHQPR